jgi:tripartite-type tricarboxylate transporter receptor subunit TctC
MRDGIVAAIPIPLAGPGFDSNRSGIGISTPKRALALPDVPTTLEEGFADSASTVWIGMFAPARTPRVIIDRLHQATLKVLQTTSMKEKLAKFGVDPMVMTPFEFDEFVRAEISSNGVVIKYLR